MPTKNELSVTSWKVSFSKKCLHSVIVTVFLFGCVTWFALFPAPDPVSQVFVSVLVTISGFPALLWLASTVNEFLNHSRHTYTLKHAPNNKIRLRGPYGDFRFTTITCVEVSTSKLERILGRGTIRLSLGDKSNETWEMSGVKDPEKWATLIRQQMVT